ncbi:inversin-like [Ptychodera flava]|uniref:inversin-like n=1 Tax=Ptychodera flava TaxID=63121 RepID=UPI00396A23A8
MSSKKEQRKIATREVSKNIPSFEVAAGGEGNIGSDSSLKREASPPTQIHAAAVNGDKSALQKAIAANPKLIDGNDQFGRTPLMFAVLADRLDCAEILLKAGAKVDAKDSGGRTSLHWTAHKGHFKCLKLLISKGANCKEKDNEGQTALHLSTRHKNTKCLALLMKQLELGEVDEQDNAKRTALHWSASYGNDEAVRMLIKQDSNIGIPDNEGKTPLHWAATAGKDSSAVNTVRLLLESAPSVINWQDYEGRTALHLAVADGNEPIVDALTSLDKCNVTALDNMFRTPLHWAAVLGHTKIVQLLLNSKADYASTDSNGATPMHYAAQNNFAETVDAFLSRDNVTDEPDLEGRTALMWAAGKGADDVIRTILKRYPDINATDKTGGTALHAAALSGHAKSVEILMEHNAQVNAEDMMKHTPLFRACEMGHLEVVKTLMKGGAKVNIVDQDGRSPLHWAALGGHAVICETLMRNGISVDVRDHVGRTPLQCAAYGGYINCMSLLMENGANPNLQDHEGMTALHWACSSGCLDAIKLLFEYKALSNHMEFNEDRFTPLDYALLNDHHDVAQYMIEQGALSITGIRDIAASKIQAHYRGYKVRKTFLERKKLLMKHEQLRKDAAKKKEESKKRQLEYRRREEMRRQRERARQALESQNSSESEQEVVDYVLPKETVITDIESEGSLSGHSERYSESLERSSVRSDVDEEISEKDQRSDSLRQKKELVDKERHRIAGWRHINESAAKIQRAWKSYLYRRQGMSKTADEVARNYRRLKGEEEYRRQVAACVIQLAWRKYYHKKLLKSLGRNKKILHTWSPSVLAAKQRSLVEQIYSEVLIAPEWYPDLPRAIRPDYMKYIPSPAALSYNFAVDQYHPMIARRGSYRAESVPTWSPRMRPGAMTRDNYGWTPDTEQYFYDDFRHMPLFNERETSADHFSYNLNR